MTKLIYLDDTYLFTHHAKVLDSGVDERGAFLLLDQTIFYPQGGGQPSDIGQIISQGRSFEVVTVRKAGDGQVRHYLAQQSVGLSKGDLGTLFVDSKNRMVNSKLHSGGHILACVIEKLFPEIRCVKAHHFPGEAYMEFEPVPADQDLFLKAVGQATDSAIKEDLKIVCSYISADECESLFRIRPSANVFRVSQIDGFPKEPCGGTHLKSLGELKAVQITKLAVKKDRLKVSYTAE